MTGADARPIVLVTGAASNLSRSVAAALADAHHIIDCAVPTAVAIAAADVARPARALNVVLGVREGRACWLYASGKPIYEDEGQTRGELSRLLF
jgi:NAD(P)-dependent dehydrogenase (short-subunit alcohol dehydrogenase family)